MNKNIILIGDSITFGYGVKKNDSFCYLLSQITSLNIQNKGINGDTTASMLNRIYNDALIEKPSCIFIMGGTNDLLCGRKISSIISNIEQMIIDSKEINSEVILGIPPCIIKEIAYKLFCPSDLYDYTEANLPLLRNKLIELAKKYNIKYINFYDIFVQKEKNSSNTIFTDGIHPNRDGHKIIFDELSNLLKTLNIF